MFFIPWSWRGYRFFWRLGWNKPHFIPLLHFVEWNAVVILEKQLNQIKWNVKGDQIAYIVRVNQFPQDMPVFVLHTFEVCSKSCGNQIAI